MSDDRYATWPTLLAELATLIGPELALELARAEGGIDRVNIPRRTDTDHPWAAIVGPEAWATIVRAYGGQCLDLPRGVYIRLRKVEILELGEQGMSHRAIARRVGVGERYVRRVLAGGGVRRQDDPRQIKLF